jgi:hypothetical protein
MTARTAGVVADAILVSAALAAAYVVCTRPPLRRLAIRLIRIWVGFGVPSYLAREGGQVFSME